MIRAYRAPDVGPKRERPRYCDEIINALHDLAERARNLPRHRDPDVFHREKSQLGVDIVAVAKWLETGVPPI